jgi:small-conductance mechanosensitive channel
MESFWEKVYWGNSVLQYVIVFTGILLAWLVIRLIKTYVLKLVKKLTERTTNHYDDLLLNVAEKFVIPFLYIFINYSIIKQLTLHPRLEKVLDGAMAFVTMFFAVRLVNNLIVLMISGYMRRKGESEERINHLNGMLLVVKAFVWIIGLLTLANNFGFNVSTLIASLGVGGIAIALASQVVLGDLFSYLVIFFDKPFEIGDFVILNSDTMGAVEYIGIKTTRIRSLSGEQLVISNTQMTSSIIRNYKRMERRRIVFKLGVVYETPVDMIRQIPQMIAEIIKAQPDITFDRAHLSDYGDFSINFEMVYYIKSADYNKYMDTQQQILFAIHEAFDKNDIEFAYPTQTLFINDPGKDKPGDKDNAKGGEPVEKEGL